MKKYIVGLLILFVMLAAGCAQDSQEETGEEANNEGAGESASDFPTEEIEMIIPFGAGGSTDTTARIVAEGAQKYLPNDQKIVPVNQPGGSGTVGMTKLLNAKPDGYTIGLGNSDAISVQPAFDNASYQPDSFQPIVKLASAPWMLAVSADAPWDTFDEWLEDMKENPGEFQYGSALVGSPGQIAMETLGKQEGLETTHVPYDGGGEVVSSLLGGNIDGGMVIASNIVSHYEEGTIKVLANFGTTELDIFEDVPTLNELGIDINMDLFYGIVAPEGLDEEAQTIIHDAFQQALEDPEVTEQLENLSISPAYADAEQLQNEYMDIYNVFEDALQDIDLSE